MAQKRAEEKEALQKKLEEFSNQLNEFHFAREKVSQLDSQLINMSKKLESLSKKHDALLSSSKYLKNEKNQRLNEVTFYPYSIRKQHHNTI